MKNEDHPLLTILEACESSSLPKTREQLAQSREVKTSEDWKKTYLKSSVINYCGCDEDLKKVEV